jgi:hypothetical protein
MSDLKFQQRKTVNVLWATSQIHGQAASVQATAPGFEGPIEVRNVVNDGAATITFPHDFTGECEVTVEGSRGGKQTGTVHVH